MYDKSKSFFQNVSSGYNWSKGKYNHFSKNTLFGRGAVTGFKDAFGWVHEATGKGIKRGYTSQGFLGLSGKTAGLTKVMGGLSLIGTAYSAYAGYRENGIVGAVSGVATSALTNAVVMGSWNYLAGMGTAGISMGLTGGLALAGIGAYGYYKAGEAGIKNMKQRKALELGTGDIGDRFGTMATMRQRSLNALQNTHVNGRMVLGNEGQMFHTPFMR